MSYHLKYPIGIYISSNHIGKEQISKWTSEIKSLHGELKELCSPLSNEQLHNSYRTGGWTIKQILFHITDSHMHSYTRFKWTLTEDSPVIKAYNEKRWAELTDTRLILLDEILDEIRVAQNRLSRVIESLNSDDLSKSFIHPESGKRIDLANLVGMYAWHGKHHLEHIRIAINNPATDYKPISCDFYDELVLLAMHKTPVSIVSQNENTTSIVIKDIITSKKEEFLILSNGSKIRLDQILKLENNSLFLRY